MNEETNEKLIYKWSALLIFLFMSLAIVDIIREFKSGETFSHLALEIFVSTLAFLWILYLWKNWATTKRELVLSRNMNRVLNNDNLKWKSENAKLLEGLSNSIQDQFEKWKLTPTESEVAWLLLKGLPFKEIAVIRGSSEKTIRQHALMIYQKSGIPGRVELSAFFLEDLFQPR